jgi:formate-dependent nitrite reductase membrane component NrfD
MASNKIGVRVFLTLSAIAATLVGVIWYFGVRRLEDALIAAGLTFIVVLVTIATLALMGKEDNHPVDQPRLK